MQHRILIGINTQVGKTMLIFRPALKNECWSEENYSWSAKPAITSNGEHWLEHYAFVWIFIVPAHWNSACLNMSLHSGHITLNLSQPIFALTPYCVPSREAVNTSFIVFGLILPCSNTRSTTLETNILCITQNAAFVWYILSQIIAHFNFDQKKGLSVYEKRLT